MAYFWVVISAILLSVFGLPNYALSAEAEVTLKRKVAIARFSNETKSKFAFLVDETGDRLGKQASDILSARLAQTGKFLLFERQDRDEFLAEQVIANMTNWM